MPEILIDANRYWQYDPHTILEREFEDVILGHKEYLFPHYFSFPFKQTVGAQGNRAKPDFIMISKNYDQWIIVEIETAHDSKTAVVDQIKKIRRANYTGSGEISYIMQKQQEPGFDISRATAMTNSMPPEFLVVNNSLNPSWRTDIERDGVDFIAVEIYTVSGQKCFRFIGKIPSILLEHLCNAKVDKYSDRIIYLSQYSSPFLQNNQNYGLIYNDMVSEWSLNPIGGKPCLVMNRRSPFKPGQILNIYKFGNFLTAR